MMRLLLPVSIYILPQPTEGPPSISSGAHSEIWIGPCDTGLIKGSPVSSLLFATFMAPLKGGLWPAGLWSQLLTVTVCFYLLVS